MKHRGGARGPYEPCHRTTIGKGALGPLKALKGSQEDSEIRELNFLPQPPWAPAASSAKGVQASVTLDSWAPALLPVSSYPKLPQVPSQTGTGVREVPTLVPRHAACLSPLNPSTSSRSPHGLGWWSQTTAIISYPPDCQCQLLPGLPLEHTFPLFSICTAVTSPGPIHLLSHLPTSTLALLPSIPHLQPGRGFSEKTQAITLLSVPQWLHMSSGQKPNSHLWLARPSLPLSPGS